MLCTLLRLFVWQIYYCGRQSAVVSPRDVTHAGPVAIVALIQLSGPTMQCDANNDVIKKEPESTVILYSFNILWNNCCNWFFSLSFSFYISLLAFRNYQSLCCAFNLSPNSVRIVNLRRTYPTWQNITIARTNNRPSFPGLFTKRDWSLTKSSSLRRQQHAKNKTLSMYYSWSDGGGKSTAIIALWAMRYCIYAALSRQGVGDALSSDDPRHLGSNVFDACCYYYRL